MFTVGRRCQATQRGEVDLATPDRVSQGVRSAEVRDYLLTEGGLGFAMESGWQTVYELTPLCSART